MYKDDVAMIKIQTILGEAEIRSKYNCPWDFAKQK